MSIPSELCIDFNLSKDYIKIIFVVYILGLYSLICSSFPGYITFLWTIFLSYHFFIQIKDKVPYHYKKLQYIGKKWVLSANDKPFMEFSKARISFECGLFLLLTLKKDKKRKNLVIFLDQITLETNKKLHLIVNHEM
ncbi:Uncharacterised protein (plasmid) [Legionella adelaidensis]|uniref:Toxin CptA n=1 Tax=Legionella adelaidensis TaxID=45056 RepID=A0A0W0R295_9GAMM|nr:hypothetical protein [Legionella adelaidensis]KTC65099.1 hypothetical protein Lade_1622 [Legionella adelaidensis]VEH85381.1 Uncharacterised protein [Legionella adelaidensis]